MIEDNRKVIILLDDLGSSIWMRYVSPSQNQQPLEASGTCPFFPIWFNHVNILTFKNVTRGISLCFTLPKFFSPFFLSFLHLQIGWHCWIEYLETVRHTQAKLKRLFLQGKSMSNFMVEMFKCKPPYLEKYWLGWTVKSYFTWMQAYFSQQLL